LRDSPRHVVPGLERVDSVAGGVLQPALADGGLRTQGSLSTVSGGRFQPDVRRVLNQYGVNFGFSRDLVSRKEYNASVFAKCSCSNCRQQWTTRALPVTVEVSGNNKYSAKIWRQRCKTCERLGNFEVDVGSYALNVATVLLRRSGLQLPRERFVASDKPHRSDLCEAGKFGRCKQCGEGNE